MAEDFEDPLQNYEPKQYDDPVERALAEEPVTAINHQPLATIPSTTKVSDAIETLASMHVACLLITDPESGELVGVFSDRDVLDKVALEQESVADKPISELMVSNPVYVYETDASASALSVMSVSGHRHVPILDLDGNLTGIISPQRVTEFLDKQLAKAE